MIQRAIKNLFLIFCLSFIPTQGFSSTQVISGGASATIVDSQYSPVMCGGLCGSNASVTQQESVVSTSGTIGKLRVKVNTAPGASPRTDTFTLTLNGSATTLTCPITGSSTTTCQDSTHSISVVAGDRIAILTNLSGTPTATTAEWTVQFSGTTTNESLILGAGSLTNFSTTNTRFAAPFGLTDPATTESAYEELIIPTSGTIKNLYARAGVSLASGNYVLTVMQNAIASTITCTISAQTCNDSTHSISVSAGDTISVRVAGNSASNATFIGMGLTFVSTTEGESILPFRASGLSTSSQFFNSTGSASGTENLRFSLAQSTTAKNLYIKLSAAPGSGNSRTFTLRANSTNTALTKQISDSSTTGNFSTDITINDDDILGIGATIGTTPTAASVSIGITGYLITQSGGGGGSSPSISASRKIPFVIEDDI